MRSRHIKIACADCGAEVWKYTRLTSEELKQRHTTCPKCWGKMKKGTAKLRRIIKKICPELRVQVYTWQLRSRFYVPPFPETYTYVLAPRKFKGGSRRYFTEQERQALGSLLTRNIHERSVILRISRSHRMMITGSEQARPVQINYALNLAKQLYKEVGALFTATKIPSRVEMRKMTHPEMSSLIVEMQTELGHP